MTSLDDLLTRAEQAPRPHRDVAVYLDPNASARIEQLEAELEELDADKRLADDRPGKLQAQIDAIAAEAAESLVIIRFRKMPAEDWAEITARSPQRIDAPIDRLYGYNVHAVGRDAAAASGERLVDEEAGTTEPLTVEQWGRLFDIMSGHEFGQIVDAIFTLNEYGPQQRIEEAKKASSASTASRSASRSASA